MIGTSVTPIRSPAGASASTARKPCPGASTSSPSALSRTVVVRTPSVTSPGPGTRLGSVLTSPRDGFSPTRPQHAAGMRIDPPPSDACAMGTMPDATAAAAPPLDPPAIRVVSHGVTAGGSESGSV